MLTGLSIVDWGTGMSGALPGKLAAELGATVIRPELEIADPFATRFPAYRAWNANKVQVPHPSDEELHRLLEHSDACIIGGDDHPDLPRSLNARELAQRYPGLVVLEICGAPDGVEPLPAHDLLAQARSGLIWEQSAKRPIPFGVRLPTYGTVIQSLMLLLDALCRRELTGRGEHVQASLLQGAITWLGPSWASVFPKDFSFPIIQCADDEWLFYYDFSGSGGVERVLGIELPPQEQFEELVARAARGWQSGELMERFIAEGVVCDLVRAPGECWDDEQLIFNNTLETTEEGQRHVRAPFTWK